MCVYELKFTHINCVVSLSAFFFVKRMQMNDLQHGFAIEMAMRMNRICLNLIVPQMWKLENALMVFQSN